ncbi:MAG: VOC family protein [Acidobacteriia bacterium]|nr:VOC family protein [Terriglobia bacterium]
MAAKVKPVPKNLHAVTPALTIRGCGKAIEFYKRALGAELVLLAPAPDGNGVWHAEMRIGNSVVFLNDEIPGMTPQGPSPAAPAAVGFWLYSADCDAAFKRAVAAGATVKMPPADMFWGDRTGTVVDPFGYIWTFGTHVKDMTEAEMMRAGEEFAKSMRGGR